MIAYIVLFGAFAVGAVGVWCTQCRESLMKADSDDAESSPIIGSPAYNNRGPDHL